MTQATIVYGAKVERSTDGTVFENIPEAKGIAVPATTTEYQDVTNLDSPGGYREYIKGLKDAGETSIPCNYTRAGYAQQIADQNANGAITYRITMPLAPGQLTADTFEYDAFPTVELEGDDVGGIVGMNIALRITGDVEWTEGT